MPEFLRPILARLVGAVVGGLVAWLAARFGISISSENADQLTAGGTAFLMVVFTVAYSLVHTGVSSKINPMDAATSTLADKGKSDQRDLKAMQ